MKLTMKNAYSFQKVIGYPDDPEMMSTDDVKRSLARWSEIIGSLLEGDKPPLDYIAGLDGFLSALATEEVEYEEPLHEYKYTVYFEYSAPMVVVANDEAHATMLAIKNLKENEIAIDMDKTWANTLIFTEDGDEIYDKFNDGYNKRFVRE